MLFGSGRPRFGAGLVATPEQEAETARLEALMQQRMPTPMSGVQQSQQATQQTQQMGWGEKVGGIGAALMAAQAAIDGDLIGGAKIAGSIGADRRELQQKMQLAQQQRLQGLEDWKWKEQYKAANPGPADDVFTQSLQAAGIDPASPEGQNLYRSRVTNMADPVVSIPLPGGQVYTGPRSQLPSALGQAPTRPIGKLTPLAGGGAGNGVSNFPSGNPLQRPW